MKKEKAQARKAYWKTWRNDKEEDKEMMAITEEHKDDDDGVKEEKCRQMTLEMMQKRKQWKEEKMQQSMGKEERDAGAMDHPDAAWGGKPGQGNTTYKEGAYKEIDDTRTLESLDSGTIESTVLCYADPQFHRMEQWLSRPLRR